MNRRLCHQLLLVIILIGWALALARLGERSLWADEGYTAYLATQADSPLVTANLQKDFNPLHFSIIMGVVRLSRHEMALRLPSVVAAVLALPVVYALGCRLFSRRAGLVGAFLLAISPFAIGYAQEARHYALFELLACLSLLLLLLALDRRNWYWWASFSVVTSLALYTHHFAWLVLGAEVIFAALILLRASLSQRRVDLRAVGLAASLLAIAVLYAPLLTSMVSWWQQQVSGPQSSLPGLEAFQLSSQFFREMVWQFGAREGRWGFYLTVGSLILGMASLVVQRKWSTLLLLALWLVLPVAFLTLIPSTHFFEYRYLIFLLPLFLLVMAEGLTSAMSVLARAVGLDHSQKLQPILVLGLTALLVVPANLPALQRHYQWEKENWRGIGSFVSENLEPDEAIFVAPRFWAHPLLFYQPHLEPYIVGGGKVSQLESAADEYGGLWYIRFVGALADPSGQLTDWITEKQFDFLIDGRACGWGIHVYYRGFDNVDPERKAELIDQAKAFCPSDPRFQPAPN